MSEIDISFEETEPEENIPKEKISRRDLIKGGAATFASLFLGGAAYDYKTAGLGVLDRLFGAFPRSARMKELKGVTEPLQRPIYYGVAANDDAWIPSEKGYDVIEKIGKEVGIRHFYQDWSEIPEASDFQLEAMNHIRDKGSVPMITWMPQVAGHDAFAQPDFALKNISEGNFDQYLKKWATAAKSFEGPFFLRFAHEMNGGWYPWGVGKHWSSEQIPNKNKATDFVNAWRHCHDIFSEVGATNATWVWCPDTAGNLSQISQLYPGDDYVDWTAMDGYNWGNTNGGHKLDFKDIFSPLYNKLLNIAPSKPVMLAEFGVERNVPNRDAWIKDVFEVQLPYNFPQIQAAVYFNRDKTKYEGVNWTVEGDDKAEKAFSDAIQSPFYKGNEFNELNSQTIPIIKSLP